MTTETEAPRIALASFTGWRSLSNRLGAGDGPSRLLKPEKKRTTFTMAEAARELRKSRRWLQDWLGKHPVDAAGVPFYAPLDRTKTFSVSDLERIRAMARLRAGGEGKYISPIIEATGEHALRDKPLADIDQIAIDNAASALYPNAPATTTNRQFYTPVSAVLKRAGIEREVKRPKGWRGSKATEWLEPEQAFPLIDACYEIEPEFGLFCLTLLHTGMRLGDPIKSKLRDLKLGEALLYVPDTKNGEPRPVHLPPVVVQAFRDQPPRMARPRKAPGHAPFVNNALATLRFKP